MTVNQIVQKFVRLRARRSYVSLHRSLQALVNVNRRKNPGFARHVDAALTKIEAKHRRGEI